MESFSMGKILVMMIMAAVMIMMISVFPSLIGEMDNASNKANTSEDSASSADSADTADDADSESTGGTVDEDISLTPLWIGGGTLAGAGIAVGGSALAYSTIRKHREHKKDEKTVRESRREDLEELRARHNTVLVDYARYETDAWLALSYPAMRDVSDEKTRALLSAMRAADRSAIREGTMKEKSVIAGNDPITEYKSAVETLETAYKTAEANAVRIEGNGLSTSEQRDIKQAKNLLRHAEDKGTSEEARRTYYQRLSATIERLNEAYAKRQHEEGFDPSVSHPPTLHTTRHQQAIESMSSSTTPADFELIRSPVVDEIESFSRGELEEATTTR